MKKVFWLSVILLMFVSVFRVGAKSNIEVWMYNNILYYSGKVPGVGGSVTTSPGFASFTSSGLGSSNFTFNIWQGSYGNVYGTFSMCDGNYDIDWEAPFGALGDPTIFYSFGNGYMGDNIGGKWWNNYNGGDFGIGFGFCDDPEEVFDHNEGFCEDIITDEVAQDFL